MERQNTSWGYIDWLENNQAVKKGVLRVGIVVIRPHMHMPAHIHFDEQIIYTFQGSGYSLINGNRIDMSADENNLLHWMPGVIHEMYNVGDTPYVHLMVTCSDQLDDVELQQENAADGKVTFQESIRCMYAVMDEFQTAFLNNLRYSFMIYDAFGNVAASSRLFPRYCRKYCGENIQNHSAYCMKKKRQPAANISDAADNSSTFCCPGGLTVMSVPILFHGYRIGYVEGGYVCTDEKQTEKDADGKLYSAPLSSVENVWIMLKRISRMLANYCELHLYHTDMEKQERLLDFERRDKEILAADLKKTESSMIDLKINNHFLFNTLNEMAAMALEGGILPLYRSIVDLSKMFQYTLRQNSRVVTLAQELEYLMSYLKLQKLRYGDELTVAYSIRVDPEQWRVPFNWMVPLAENAFTHGFTAGQNKTICISASEENGWLEVEIQNSGVILEDSVLKALRIRMRGNESHGMPMIYQKMANLYGHQFVMDIHTVKGGTAVTLSLPKLPVTVQGTEEKS